MCATGNAVRGLKRAENLGHVMRTWLCHQLINNALETNDNDKRPNKWHLRHIYHHHHLHHIQFSQFLLAASGLCIPGSGDPRPGRRR